MPWYAYAATWCLRTPQSADRTETFLLDEQSLKLEAWQGLHFKKLSALVGMVLRVEFLQTPDVVVLDGSGNGSLEDLCRMYLWRFAIEHMFRF